MLIRDITLQECRQLLHRTGFGRLACARDNEPYVVPVYFAYELDRLYGFTTLGRKIEWMRANPKVCVEVDEVENHFQWSSVIVTGRYQELPNTAEFGAGRLHALTVLEKRALWWQTAMATKQIPTRDQNAEPVVYCIHIEAMTGLRAVPNVIESSIGLEDQASAS